MIIAQFPEQWLDFVFFVSCSWQLAQLAEDPSVIDPIDRGHVVSDVLMLCDVGLVNADVCKLVPEWVMPRGGLVPTDPHFVWSRDAVHYITSVIGNRHASYLASTNRSQ